MFINEKRERENDFKYFLWADWCSESTNIVEEQETQSHECEVYYVLAMYVVLPSVITNALSYCYCGSYIVPLPKCYLYVLLQSLGLSLFGSVSSQGKKGANM